MLFLPFYVATLDKLSTVLVSFASYIHGILAFYILHNIYLCPTSRKLHQPESMRVTRINYRSPTVAHLPEMGASGNGGKLSHSPSDSEVLLSVDSANMS